MVLGVLLYSGFAVSRSADKVEGQQELAQTGQQLDAVADPLKRLCDTDPSVRERVGQACDAAAQAVSAAPERGATGRTGAAGVAGTPGIAGVAGIDGRDGVDGKAGADGQSITGPSGAPGAPGLTPPCYFEPAQCRGADGTNGTNGKDGAPGRNAELPTSYTKNYEDGRTETCSRAGGDDSAPVYNCTTSP